MNIDFRNTNSLWCSVMVETLHRCGVRQAVVSPGSRSAPIVFALAAHSGIEAIPVLDERSASFFALGLAKQNAFVRPVALVCTSGTAGANFFPAIIEAQESGVPLIVITADRPPEMRECASGQTIDQQKLYGSHVNWYHEFATPEASLERLRYLRQTIAYACERAITPERGPVHVNAPFRDPLPPVESASASAAHLSGKIGEEFFEHLTGADANRVLPISGPAARSAKSGRTIIIAGPGACAAEVERVATQTEWPVLADALSAARHAAYVPDIVRVSAYDAILRNERVARELAPEFVLCLGGWPTSKVLRAWLDKVQPEILLVAPTARNRDALHGRTRWATDISGIDFSTRCEPSYRTAWTRSEASARAVIDGELGSAIRPDDLFEPRATLLLAQHLPERTPLFVASSMPVRDVEYFWPANSHRTQFYFNRGANGIDGTLSTALGVAHGNECPAVLLTGDLSLLHDTNGFLLASGKHFRGSLTIVLINNNGGGIFEHLPVAQFEPPFEEFFATPQNVDFAKLCATYGVEHVAVRDWTQFAELIAVLPARGVRVLEIRTDRKRDTARRKALLAKAAV